MRRAEVCGSLLVGLTAAVLWPGVAAGSGAGWSWPLGGPQAVSRPFAPPEHRYGAGHRGVDLPAPPGTAVAAAGPGRVSYAGLLAGRGVVVVVHGALRTTYEPVDAVVSGGEAVSAGQVLGVLQPGHAGCPEPACLHWGLRRGEDYLDPVALVERAPVRLLPLSAAVVEGPAGGSADPTASGSGGSGAPSGAGPSSATAALAGTVLAGALAATVAGGRAGRRRGG
jgi:murein DD-endopeptidase MepM/ murein hydrolase activator NlpD